MEYDLRRPDNVKIRDNYDENHEHVLTLNHRPSDVIVIVEDAEMAQESGYAEDIDGDYFVYEFDGISKQGDITEFEDKEEAVQDAVERVNRIDEWVEKNWKNEGADK